MANLKQLQTHEKRIGEYRYFIRPFRAFVAANLSAELINLVSPVLSMIAPLIGQISDASDVNIMDMDAEKIFNSASPALAKLDADKLESVMKTLLVTYRNVSVEGPGVDGTEVLSQDLADEIFCTGLDEMFILCFEVVRINYAGFFMKLGARSGGLKDLLRSPMAKNTGDSATST